MPTSFRVDAVIKPEYVSMVEGYMEEKEWLHASPVVKAWHDYLGRNGGYQLVDAYMYYDDYPRQGYTLALFNSLDRTLVLTGNVDPSFDISSMVELLLKPMSQKCLFTVD